MSLRQSSLLSVFDRRTAAVTILSVAAVMVTHLATDAWKAIHRDGPAGPATIDVPGQATRHLAPDQMSFIVTVHGRGVDQAEAMTKLRKNLASVQESLRAHSIADAELDYASVSATDSSDSTYDDNGNLITPTAADAWDASQDITVLLKDIKRGVAAHQAIASASAFDDAEVTEASCSATVLDPTRDSLLREARQNAHAQARAALGQYGGKLGKLVRASIGSIDIGSDCTGIVLTANAAATYELK